MAIPTSPFARYRASQLALSDNDPVGTWTDEGSGTNDLTQTGAARPTFEASGFNGHPSVLFDGIDDHMQTAAYAAALSQPTSIVIMGEYVTVDAAAVEYVFDAAASADRQILLHDGTAGGDPWIMVSPSAAVTTDTPVGKAGDDLCIVAIFNGNSSEFHVNNGGDVQANNPGSNALGSFSLMARFDATSNQANMRIVEVLIYDRALNGTELTDLQDYFVATYQTAATPEVTASIPLTLDVAAQAQTDHSVTAAVGLSLDVAATATAIHQAQASIPLMLDMAAATQTQHDATSAIPLTLDIAAVAEAPGVASAQAAIGLTFDIAPTTQAQHDAGTAIPLELALVPETFDPARKGRPFQPLATQRELQPDSVARSIRPAAALRVIQPTAGVP